VVPWPFSCEAVVGQFSKLDEQAREEGEEELREALGHQAVQVVHHLVARDRHTEQGRASFERDGIRAWSKGLERGRTSQDQTLRLAGI